MKILFLMLLCVHNVQSGILGTLQQKLTSFKGKVSAAFSRKKGAEQQQQAQMQHQELSGRSLVTTNNQSSQPPKRTFIKGVKEGLSNVKRRIVEYFKPKQSNQHVQVNQEGDVPDLDESYLTHSLSKAPSRRGSIADRVDEQPVASVSQIKQEEAVVPNGMSAITNSETPYSPKRRHSYNQSSVQNVSIKRSGSLNIPPFVTPQGSNKPPILPKPEWLQNKKQQAKEIFPINAPNKISGQEETHAIEVGYKQPSVGLGEIVSPPEQIQKYVTQSAVAVEDQKHVAEIRKIFESKSTAIPTGRAPLKRQTSLNKAPVNQASPQENIVQAASESGNSDLD